MANRELILKSVNKVEDRLLIAKLLDKASKCEKSGSLICSDFLDPYQRTLAERVLSKNGDVLFTFDGGYSGAERVIIVFRPYFMSEEEMDGFGKPFRLIKVSLSGRESLNHRDYLGALMGLGIKREKIGDILVREEGCRIVVLKEIADFIGYNLSKVGNTSVETEITEIDELDTQEPKLKTINATVASLRLDSVSSAGFGISRSKMVDYIKSQKVNLNWETTDSLNKMVKEGDTISIRGKGRVVLEAVGRITKKGRIGITLKKFI